MIIFQDQDQISSEFSIEYLFRPIGSSPLPNRIYNVASLIFRFYWFDVLIHVCFWIWTILNVRCLIKFCSKPSLLFIPVVLFSISNLYGRICIFILTSSDKLPFNFNTLNVWKRTRRGKVMLFFSQSFKILKRSLIYLPTDKNRMEEEVITYLDFLGEFSLNVAVE